MRRSRWGANTAWLVVLALGCRDAPALFESPTLDPLGPAPYRLTFNPGSDRAPAWVAGSDSLMYLAEDVASGLPILRVIHREGGTASAVFPELQGGSISVRMQSMAPDPTGARVAMVSLLSANEELCGNTSASCMPDVVLPAPSRLDSAFVRERVRGAAGPPDADPSLVVHYDGRRFDATMPPPGFPGQWVITLHPFQHRFNQTDRPPTRPSYSPAGDRLVLSDGLRLLTWSPGAAPQEIPGTDDGIRPAWSPTGDWIAYEYVGRTNEITTFCTHVDQFGIARCVEQRTQWTYQAPMIAIVRPDGSGWQVLVPGSEPAWSGDGTRIFYEGAGGIRSVALDGSGDMAVPGTGGGLDPAPSPDGRWLAFSLPGADGLDLWIVELVP